MKLKRELFWVVLLYFLLFTVLFLALMPEAFLNLNNYLFGMEGDAIKNYFTYMYYLKYDTGNWFTGMHYPLPELLVFTDNQPILAMAVKNLGMFGLASEQYGLGVFNALLLLSIPITACFLFLLLKQFEVRSILAFLGAFFIALMSPQLMRITGHYSLSYGFVIPVFWLISLRLDKQITPIRYVLLAIVLTLIFSLLHVYFIGISLVFFGAIFFVKCLMLKTHKASFKTMAIIYLPIILVPILVFKITIGAIDIFSDRVEIPWGFLNYRTSYSALFFSNLSPLSNLYPKFIQVGKLSGEGYAYIGFFGLPFCVFVLYKVFKEWIKEKKISIAAINLTSKQPIVPYLYVALLTLIFAAAFPFYMPPFDSLINYLSPIAQFRSPGRFAWIFYFVFMVYFMIWIQQCMQSKYKMVWVFVVGVLLTESVLYAKSIFNLMPKNYQEQVFHSSEIANSFKQNSVETKNYQALMVFPFFANGNEKAGFEGSLNSQLMAYAASYQLGLPLINYSIARAPVNSTNQILELMSNPILDKAYLQKFNAQKPLLIMATDSSFAPIENWWIGHATFLHSYKNCRFYALNISAIQKAQRQAIDLVAQANWQKHARLKNVWLDGVDSGFFLFKPLWQSLPGLFNADKETLLNYSRQVIYEGALPVDEELEVSFWGTSSIKYNKLPAIIFTEYDADGKKVNHHHSHTDNPEIFKNCIRRAVRFKPSGKNHKIVIETDAFGYSVSSLLIRSTSINYLYQFQSQWYYNNYPIDITEKDLGSVAPKFN